LLGSSNKGLWTGILRRTSPVLNPPAFPELQEELHAFFGPIIAALPAPEGAKGLWDPGGGTWH
jgi:hypothetical protein